MKPAEKKIIETIKTAPAFPVKGCGHVRHEITKELYDYLCDLVGVDSHKGHAHFCTVFARRSYTARYNRLQFGGDRYYVSEELKALFVRCAKSFKKLPQF